MRLLKIEILNQCGLLQDMSAESILERMKSYKDSSDCSGMKTVASKVLMGNPLRMIEFIGKVYLPMNELYTKNGRSYAGFMGFFSKKYVTIT